MRGDKTDNTAQNAGTTSSRGTSWPFLGQGAIPAGWGGRIRTCACRYQKPVPYRLATPQQPVRRALYSAATPIARRARSKKIGRAEVRTPVTHAQIVYRLVLEQNNERNKH